ncbi:MAG: cellobiose phosphorylase [Candidatus Omnitrophota bacterium]
MKKNRVVKYYLKKDGNFVIENYDLAKPFASFFPGIAGLFGIPMWVFYVNRGQGIVSFGTQNKKHAILEFFPANRAWQFVSRRGFRTFLKIKKENKTLYYEPFQNDLCSEPMDLQRSMMISSEAFSVSEINHSLGLHIQAEYSVLGEEPLACITRKLSVENISGRKLEINILDGLPQVVPYGVNDRFLKELGRTIEAWMRVDYVSSFKIPFYKLVVDPTDRPQVIYIQGGNFYYSYSLINKKIKKNDFIVDPELIFGAVNDFNYPQEYYQAEFKIPQNQITCSKTPAAFSHNNFFLNDKQAASMITFMGYAQNEQILQKIMEKVQAKNFLDKKQQDYKKTIAQLQSKIFTASGNTAYDLYAQQTYLDNILRGGYPLTIKHKDKSHIFHVYSRKHGDLERDYNNFLTEATYFSQGNGNYRDVNQNRRNDVWFNPDVREENVLTFFNLLQLDGFNPLVVFGDRFKLHREKDFKKIRNLFSREKDFECIIDFIKKQFTPGCLFFFMEQNNIKIKTSKMKFLSEILSYCDKKQNAFHGEGFWVDHWTYNIDALDAYLAIYPEKLKDLLLRKKEFVFFNNFVSVKPREEKYVLFEGNARQYHAISVEGAENSFDDNNNASDDDWVRTNYGKGSIYKTNLMVKIICLITNKIASLDAFGCGIDMEANKPGWYDALNGLPGLFGSSVCETMELKRLINFIQAAIDQLSLPPDDTIFLPQELHEFLLGVDEIITHNLKSCIPNKDLLYWDKTYLLKESYRKSIYGGLSGNEKKLDIATFGKILVRMNEKLFQSIAKTKDKKSGLHHTYYINEVVDYEKIKEQNTKGFKKSKDGLFCIRPKKFKQNPLPLFLEGQVHALRIAQEKSGVKKLYAATKKSVLYDKKLKMYKVNAPLHDMSEEIGRARIFTPGWLENESIWLHMEYKFILELLRNGLNDEFFNEFKNILIPFQPAERYGRSILENSSFLVSSAFPNSKLHGNGFVARLSGSTAEFITLWLWMNVGQRPFKLDAEGSLYLEFKPVLPDWMFTKNKSRVEYLCVNGEKVKLDLAKNTYAFNFLGDILVVYYNPKMKHTYGDKSVKPNQIKITLKNAQQIVVNSSRLSRKYAELIRNKQVRRIDIKLF